MPTDQNNDRFSVPVSRGGEPYDQYINANFDALATAVPDRGPVNDRPSASNDFAPNKYYAEGEEIDYLNTGASWRAFAIPADGIHAARAGYVTAIGADLGIVDAVDPSGSSTPVQDAINLLPDGGGEIIIPPGGVTNSGTISVTHNVSIRGFGPGHQDPPVSEIHVDVEDADCIRLAASSSGSRNNAQYNTLDGFILRGPGQASSSGIGIHAPNGVNHLHIGHLDVVELGNQILNIQGGNEYHIDNLTCHGIEPQASGASEVMEFAGNSAGVTIGLIAGYPRGNQTDSSIDRFCHIAGGSFNIQHMNIGGACRRALETDDLTCVNVGTVRHEPTALEGDLSTTESALSAVTHNGAGVCRIGAVMNVDIGEVTHDAIYVASAPSGGSGTSGNYFGPVRAAGAINNAIVDVQTDATQQKNVYWGASADVNNSSGATLSNPWACLADLTTVS